jgi:hypothetical protein
MLRPLYLLFDVLLGIFHPFLLQIIHRYRPKTTTRNTMEENRHRTHACRHIFLDMMLIDMHSAW